MQRSGGSEAVRDLPALESALAQPRMTFDGVDLYPDLAAKAAALAYSLIGNHPFLDGNKRIGHAAMETFLVLNGYELDTHIDEAERIILDVAGGKCSRALFSEWVKARTRPLE
jgi:death-on-curing protein